MLIAVALMFLRVAEVEQSTAVVAAHTLKLQPQAVGTITHLWSGMHNLRIAGRPGVPSAALSPGMPPA